MLRFRGRFFDSLVLATGPSVRQDDLANKNAEVDEARSRIDSLKEQLERLKAGQPVNVAVATQGASHLRTMQ